MTKPTITADSFPKFTFANLDEVKNFVLAEGDIVVSDLQTVVDKSCQDSKHFLMKGIILSATPYPDDKTWSIKVGDEVLVEVNDRELIPVGNSYVALLCGHYDVKATLKKPDAEQA